MAKKGQYVRAVLARTWPDYATLIGLVIFLIVLKETVTGNKRAFTPGVIEDSGFPLKSTDTVPSWTLQTFVWIIPVSTIIVAGFLHMLTPLQAHQHVLNFLIMYALTGVLTNCIKLQIGRPRPSFLPRCFPASDTTATAFADIPSSTENTTATHFEAIPFSSVTQPICTNEDQSDIDGAYKSFPSGHASYSASAGMYLTLFLMCMLRVFSGVAPAASAVVALVPVSLGGWVGLTRISDYEHHFTDVLAGALLGMVIATIFFFQAQAIKNDARMLDVEGMSPVSHTPLGTADDSRPVAEAVRTRVSNDFSEVSQGEGDLRMRSSRDLNAAAEIKQSATVKPFT